METVLFITMLFISILSVAKGLECFNCMYQDTNLPLDFGIPEDPSCQRGSTPDERFKVDCSGMNFEGEEGDNSTYTCVDISMDGYYILSPIFTWNGTLRGCVESNKANASAFTEECLDGKLGKVAFHSSIPEIKDILETYTGYFHPELTDTHVCNCNDELCNGDQ